MRRCCAVTVVLCSIGRSGAFLEAGCETSNRLTGVRWDPTPRRNVPVRRSSTGSSFLSSDDSQDEERNEYRSVSDYMGGHHAGKFDFHTHIYGVTSLNYEKSIVFDDAAGKADDTWRLAPLPDELLSEPSAPQWASRRVDVSLAGRLDVGGTGDAAAVEIANEEPSWEPFFCTVEDESGNRMRRIEQLLDIRPENGHLAPRGGRRPFADRCTIRADAKTEGHRLEELKRILSDPTASQIYLVVRTETDHCSFRLCTTDRSSLSPA